MQSELNLWVFALKGFHTSADTDTDTSTDKDTSGWRGQRNTYLHAYILHSVFCIRLQQTSNLHAFVGVSSPRNISRISAEWTLTKPKEHVLKGGEQKINKYVYFYKLCGIVNGK